MASGAAIAAERGWAAYGSGVVGNGVGCGVAVAAGDEEVSEVERTGREDERLAELQPESRNAKPAAARQARRRNVMTIERTLMADRYPPDGVR